MSIPSKRRKKKKRLKSAAQQYVDSQNGRENKPTE